MSNRLSTASIKQSASVAPASKTGLSPQNGLEGLKQWRHDVPAALVVALVSVPLSLGIALASGAPPICGITSEIIAGLIFPILGGAYVTVSGPAAGLAPILFGAITNLGQGDMQSGYKMVLAVIMLTGVLQLILTKLNAAKFSQLFPTAAIHGMLAAIGFMLMAKQLPYFVGCKFQAHEFFPMLMELPRHFDMELIPNVFSIGVICLLALFSLSSTQLRGGLLRFVPPQLVVVLAGIALGHIFRLDPKYLLQIPANPLAHSIVMPDFQGLLAHPNIIPTAILFILALTFVDGTESLATVQAVDRIDPFRRKSCPNRTLMAMGVSNICSALIGGLTIIPGIIKSTTCIVSGGRTSWVNFYNALFLITFLLVGSGVIKLIPMAALGAVLCHIGYKLAGPHKWRDMAAHGSDQLAIFAVTIVVTLCTDLLVGIGAGMLTKLAILLYFSHQTSQNPLKRPDYGVKSIERAVAQIIKSPVDSIKKDQGVITVQLSGALNCFNTLGLRNAMNGIGEEIDSIVLQFSPNVTLIDYSTNLYLKTLKGEMQQLGKGIEFMGLSDLEGSPNKILGLCYRKPGSSQLLKEEASNLISV